MDEKDGMKRWLGLVLADCKLPKLVGLSDQKEHPGQRLDEEERTMSGNRNGQSLVIGNRLDNK
jgi:hypothetical protein